MTACQPLLTHWRLLLLSAPAWQQKDMKWDLVQEIFCFFVPVLFFFSSPGVCRCVCPPGAFLQRPTCGWCGSCQGFGAVLWRCVSTHGSFLVPEDASTHTHTRTHPNTQNYVKFGSETPGAPATHLVNQWRTLNTHKVRWKLNVPCLQKKKNKKKTSHFTPLCLHLVPNIPQRSVLNVQLPG